MRCIAILNPAARSGQAGKKRASLEAALRAAGLNATVWVTQAPGEAATLARQAAAEADAVIAIGGDGTVHEVSRGVLASPKPVPLGILPFGTGNDFVKMLGMARDPAVAARQLAGATPVAVDYGVVRWTADGTTAERVFVNAVGIGFDAHAAAEAEALKALPGLTGYVVAVLRTLRRWQAPQVRITGAASPGTPASVLYEGALLLVTAGNGVSSGGTFYITPRASVTDGLFDVCAVADASPWRIVRMLPRVLRGRHEHEPEVHTARLHSVQIMPEAGLPVHADGEMLSRCAEAVEVEVVPGGLTVLMPA